MLTFDSSYHHQQSFVLLLYTMLCWNSTDYEFAVSGMECVYSGIDWVKMQDMNGKDLVASNLLMIFD